MADRLQPHDVETFLRSAAMAPLAPETVRQVLEQHRELLAERAELTALLGRLMPAWAECRAALNEISGRLG